MVLVIFTQCASSQKMEINAPVTVKSPYFEKWYDLDDAGFTLYIPIEKSENVILEYAYFKQKKIELTKEEGQSVYVGKYTYAKKNKDLVMSSDPKDEFNNTVRGIERIPYRLKENECVVEYVKEGEKGHFRIPAVLEKIK